MRVSRRVRRAFGSAAVAVVGAALCGLVAGCAGLRGALGAGPDLRDRPAVAVVPFENPSRSRVPPGAEIALRGLFVRDLVGSGQFRVTADEHAEEILRDAGPGQRFSFLRLRREAPREPSRADYVVKGFVTDWRHGMPPADGLLSRFRRGPSPDRNLALAVLRVVVVDAATRTVVLDESVRGECRTDGRPAEEVYRGMSPESELFRETPLGKAAAAAAEAARERVAETIAAERWYPAVARVADGIVYVTGGTDRRMREADLWDVFRVSERLTDPRTGENLGGPPMRRTGVVRITRVDERYSEARILEGSVERGDTLRLRGSSPN